jgi:hypothetical protein
MKKTFHTVKRFRFDSDGHSAKRIEIGRMRKTTGIIIEISDFPATSSTRFR